jgi:Ca2+-binding RTX toxin-like protein
VLWKRLAVLVAAMVTALVLASGVALAVVKIGGPGNDTIKGTNEADLLKGEGGDDTIYGLAGNDLVKYTSEGRRIAGGVYGGYGDDELHGDEGHDTVSGGRGDDRIYGSEGSEIGQSLRSGAFLYGGLSGGQGDDEIYGGPGADESSGGYGDDTINLGPGDDRCPPGCRTIYIVPEGGPGSDVMRGGDGRDDVFGDTYGPDGNDPEGGPDTLYGNSGSDALDGDTGADKLYGGLGNDDLIDYEVSERFAAADELHGGPGDDTLLGVVYVEGCCSVIPTMPGNNVFDGGEGNDRIITDANDPNHAADPDFVYGGPGSDTIDTRNPPLGTTAQDEVHCGDGVDRVKADPADQVDADCENVTRN